MSPNDNRPQPNRRNTSSPRHRALLATIATSLAVIGLAVPVPAASAATTFTPPTANVGIIPLPADVFTLSANGTLIPTLPLSTPPSAPLFNLAGNALNLTWGQWSSATAKSYAWTVTHNGTTHTQFLITMSGLVPNGVYSLFYRTFGPDSNNALCPNIEPAVALTAAFPQFQTPDPDSFAATSSGKGLFLRQRPRGPAGRATTPDPSHLPLQRTGLRAGHQPGRIPRARPQHRSLPLKLRHRRDAPAPDHPEVS
jgi:hypothetical protein